MTLKLPDKIYIQTEDQFGNKAESLDDIESYYWERVNDSDVVYCRVGKKVPSHAELEDLQNELERVLSVVRALEKGNKVIWLGGKPHVLAERFNQQEQQ